MTLSRPPTMSRTFGVLAPDEPELDEVELSDPQAVRPAASASTAVAVVRARRDFTDGSPSGWGTCGESGGKAGAGESDPGAAGRGVRAPGQEAALDAGEDQLGAQRESGRDDHRGVDPGRVER